MRVGSNSVSNRTRGRARPASRARPPSKGNTNITASSTRGCLRENGWALLRTTVRRRRLETVRGTNLLAPAARHPWRRCHSCPRSAVCEQNKKNWRIAGGPPPTGHNALGDGCSLKLKGPLAALSDYRILDTDSKVDFTEAVASQGGDDVRHLALVMPRYAGTKRSARVPFGIPALPPHRKALPWRLEVLRRKPRGRSRTSAVSVTPVTCRARSRTRRAWLSAQAHGDPLPHSKHFKNTLLAVVCCEADRERHRRSAPTR